MSPTLRLAGRVCLGLGIDDPEAWLANVSQRTLAFWEAFYMLEPWGRECERDAVQSAQLSALGATIAASNGIKPKPPLRVADFMPANWHQPAAPTNTNSIKAAEQAFAAKWGRK
jgi:hypothetical protein